MFPPLFVREGLGVSSGRVAEGCCCSFTFRSRCGDDGSIFNVLVTMGDNQDTARNRYIRVETNFGSFSKHLYLSTDCWTDCPGIV